MVPVSEHESASPLTVRENKNKKKFRQLNIALFVALIFSNGNFVLFVAVAVCVCLPLLSRKNKQQRHQKSGVLGSDMLDFSERSQFDDEPLYETATPPSPPRSPPRHEDPLKSVTVPSDAVLFNEVQASPRIPPFTDESENAWGNDDDYGDDDDENILDLSLTAQRAFAEPDLAEPEPLVTAEPDAEPDPEPSLSPGSISSNSPTLREQARAAAAEQALAHAIQQTHDAQRECTTSQRDLQTIRAAPLQLQPAAERLVILQQQHQLELQTQYQIIDRKTATIHQLEASVQSLQSQRLQNHATHRVRHEHWQETCASLSVELISVAQERDLLQESLRECSRALHQQTLPPLVGPQHPLDISDNDDVVNDVNNDNELQQQLDDYMTESESIKESLRETKWHNGQLQQHLDDLTFESETLKQDLKATKLDRASLKAECDEAMQAALEEVYQQRNGDEDAAREDLQTQLAVVTSENSSLQAELRAVLADQKVVESRLALATTGQDQQLLVANATVQQLKEALTHSTAQLEEAQSEMDARQGQLDTASSEKDALLARLEMAAVDQRDLESKLEQALVKVATKTAQSDVLAQLEELLIETNAQLEVSHSETQSLQSQWNTILSEKNALEAQLAVVSSEKNALKDALEQTKTLLHVLQSDGAKADQLEASLARTVAQLEVSQSATGDLQKRLDDVAAEKNALQLQLQESLLQDSDEQSQLEAFFVEKELLLTRLSEAESCLAEAQRTANVDSRVTLRANSLQSHLDEAVASMAAKEDELAGVSAALDDLELEKELVESELKEALKEIATLQNEFSRVEKLEATLAAKERETYRLFAEERQKQSTDLESARQEMQVLSDELETLRSLSVASNAVLDQAQLSLVSSEDNDYRAVQAPDCLLDDLKSQKDIAEAGLMDVQREMTLQRESSTWSSAGSSMVSLNTLPSELGWLSPESSPSKSGLVCNSSTFLEDSTSAFPAISSYSPSAQSVASRERRSVEGKDESSPLTAYDEAGSSCNTSLVVATYVLKILLVLHSFLDICLSRLLFPSLQVSHDTTARMGR